MNQEERSTCPDCHQDLAPGHSCSRQWQRLANEIRDVERMFRLRPGSIGFASLRDLLLNARELVGTWPHLESDAKTDPTAILNAIVREAELVADLRAALGRMEMDGDLGVPSSPAVLDPSS